METIARLLQAILLLAVCVYLLKQDLAAVVVRSFFTPAKAESHSEEHSENSITASNSSSSFTSERK